MRQGVVAAGLALVLAAIVATGRVRADDTWVEATRDADAERIADEYAKAMEDADRATLLAASEGASPARLRKLVMGAARSYELAAKLVPGDAEAHWRAAAVLFGFFVCDTETVLCQPRTVDAKLFRRIISHWDAAEAAAPLDPRLSEIRFERAILRTKLAGDADLREAIVDYERLLESPSLFSERALILGNLAESYMMIGDIDSAILRYRAATAEGSDTSLFYGLAVAYDRDGQGAKAREIIAALGAEQFKVWRQAVSEGKTFYVPEGEVFYYFGLVYEALGDDRHAIAAWKRYLESGAHAQFQPRARVHLDALTARRDKDAKSSR